MAFMSLFYEEELKIDLAQKQVIKDHLEPNPKFV